jgi:hypothetical protein
VTTHSLKTWPRPFAAVLDGTKTHEIRVADRDYKVGDVLHLREWVPWQQCDYGGGRYTGREILVEVTYLTSGGSWGLPHGLCVMSIRKADAGVGADGIRDPEHPCADYKRGAPAGQCESDGYYLCAGCEHRQPAARVEEQLR